MAGFFSRLFGKSQKQTSSSTDKPSQMPDLSRHVRKLLKQRNKVLQEYASKGFVTPGRLDKLNMAYNNAINKAKDEYPAIYFIMSEKCEKLKEWDEQVSWLKKAKDHLDMNNRFWGVLTYSRLGWAHYMGRGCIQDKDMAYFLFNKGYEYDSFRASFDIAIVHLLGISCKPDLSKSLQYLRSSIVTMRHIIISAIQYYLDGIQTCSVNEEEWENYLMGLDLFTIQSKGEEAIPYLRRSLDMGFLPASIILGDIYFERCDVETAMKIVSPAHKAGYIPATHQLAFYLNQTIIGKVNSFDVMKTVATLFRYSAEKGYIPSYIALGNCYMYGYHGRNLQLAMKWFKLAMEEGEVGAEELYLAARRMLYDYD